MNAAACTLLEALRARGEAPFLEFDDRTVSGAALADAVAEAAARARALPVGLEAGHVVALRGRHPALRVAAPLAAWSLGLCTQWLGEREPTSSVDGMLAASGARCLLGWSDGAFEPLPLRPRHDVRLPAGTLLQTSGSGGRAKLVLHELERHLEAARAANAFLGLGPGDRVLLSLPTHHVGGLATVFRALLSGAALCVPGAAVGLDEALTRHAPTHVSLVATQLGRLLRAEATRAALGACRAVILGGGPLPGRLREEALAAGIALVVTYGATETAAFVAAASDADVVRRPAAAGRPLPGRDVAVDAEGRIAVGGAGLFAGYLVEGRLQPARDEHGRWRSGDRGRLEDGVLYVTGRADRMFVSGGENIQPEEIEAALLDLAGVDAAAVVPVDDEEFGARPVAFVEGRALDAAALDRALREVLPGFKTPDAYYRLPAPGPGRLKPDLRLLAARANDPLAAGTLARI